MVTYIPPHLLYLEITTECHSLLMVFPAGILGYMPKPGIFFLCNNTVHRVCLFKQTLCFLFSLNANICVCLCKHQLWYSQKNQHRKYLCIANKQATVETAVCVTPHALHTQSISSLYTARERRPSPPLQVGIHLSPSLPRDSCPDSPSVCSDLCLGPWGEPKWPTKGVSGMVPTQ